MVTVKIAPDSLSEDLVASHGVVVMCGRPGEEVSKWGSFCHEKVLWTGVINCTTAPLTCFYPKSTTGIPVGELSILQIIFVLLQACVGC